MRTLFHSLVYLALGVWLGGLIFFGAILAPLAFSQLPPLFGVQGLHAAGLLDTPLDSSDLMSWGAAGAGQWITIYSNPGHAYMIIAGLRLDTSAAGVTRQLAAAAKDKKALQSGPRWRPAPRSSHGFTRRHPLGY